MGALLGGAVLGSIISGGIVLERLSSGSGDVALVVNALVTLLAILTVGALQRWMPVVKRVLVLEVAGALVGILGVHAALRFGWIRGAPWLSERPAQFVNDLVAVLTTLALAWACARRLDLRALVAALVVMTLYRATSRLWHLDAAPHGFVFTVQDLVLAHCAAAALALPLYRQMTTHAE